MRLNHNESAVSADVFSAVVRDFLHFHAENHIYMDRYCDLHFHVKMSDHAENRVRQRSAVIKNRRGSRRKSFLLRGAVGDFLRENVGACF